MSVPKHLRCNFGFGNSWEQKMKKISTRQRRSMPPCASHLMACLILAGMLPALGHAQMVDNGDGTITDMSTNLMWLKDASNGQADWSGALAWANNLNFAGHTDWRLPSGTNSSDGTVCNSLPAGANCTETEFGSLYFGYGVLNLYTSGVFDNIGGRYYATSTEFPPDTSLAMAQDFVDGGQNPRAKTAQFDLWAVRDTGTAAGDLIDNGDGTVTDTVQCLTWTKDANLPCTQNYGAGNWQGACWFYSAESAEEWAENLDYSGHQDWRLNREIFPDQSELDNLFYDVLGNPAGGPPSNTGPFINVLQQTPFTYYDGSLNRVTVQREHKRYWLTAAPINPGREPSFDIKDQTYHDHFMTDGASNSVWAVRDSCDIVPKACADGADNDGDGLIDMLDPGCVTADDNDETGGLVDNGDGTVTDADVCLMWAQDANLAGSHLTFTQAESFAAGQTLAGHNDWRVPDAQNFDGSGPCVTFGGGADPCTDSELGHLYHTELGNAAGGPLSNVGPFSNMTSDFYWSKSTSGSYEFGFLNGSQSNALGSNNNRVLIARDHVDPAIGCQAAGASQCSDGIDNDGDGLIDYPHDKGCCSADDATEGYRAIRGKLTHTIAKMIPANIGSYFESRPIAAMSIQRDFNNLFLCRQYLRDIEEELEHLNICFEGPVTTGAPRQCPPLDCLVDGPGCMDPYGFIRVDVPDQALHAFAQLVEGQVSDLEFDEQINAMLTSGQITVDTKPARTRYLPPISLTLGLLVLLGVALVIGFAYRSGRKRPG